MLSDVFNNLRSNELFTAYTQTHNIKTHIYDMET